MTITPQDIQAKQFHVRLRGFDVDEVDKFLEQVAEEFLILSLEHKQAFEKIANQDKEIANFRNKEQAFQSAILSAQKISDEMLEKSRQEAEGTLEQARLEATELEARSKEEAETLLSQATREAEAMREKAAAEARSLVENYGARMLELTGEINRLITMKNRIIEDLRQMLDGYRRSIESGVPAGLEDLEPIPEPEEIVPGLVPSAAVAREAPSSEELAAPSGDTESGEDELDDLYERIDLPEEIVEETHAGSNTSGNEDDEMASLELSDIEALELDDDQSHEDIAISGDNDLKLDPEISIPELGEDMLLSLEDPLDELEPSITIQEDSDKG